jgi:hypothetical protein
MPYHLEKVGRKYRVITTATGVAHSKEPITKKKAEAQLRILNRHTDVVEHLGGAFGMPSVRQSSGNRSDAQNEREQQVANQATGLISGSAGMLLTAAQMINAAPGVQEFLGSIGLKTGDQIAQENADRQANAFFDWYSQQGLQEHLALEEWKREAGREGAKFLWAQSESLKLPKSYQPQTAEEWERAAAIRRENAQAEELTRTAYSQGRQQLEADLKAERLAKQRQALQQQNQQHLSGLNQRSAAVQSQITTAREALAKSRILQQQKREDQQLFLTKVNDINRSDFFSQERVAREARQKMIEAEQRRQAIKAAALNRALAPPSADAPQMVPTLGRRLPPSILFKP